MDSYLLGAAVSEAIELKEKKCALQATLVGHGYRPNDELFIAAMQLHHNVEMLKEDLSRTK